MILFYVSAAHPSQLIRPGEKCSGACAKREAWSLLSAPRFIFETWVKSQMFAGLSNESLRLWGFHRFAYYNAPMGPVWERFSSQDVPKIWWPCGNIVLRGFQRRSAERNETPIICVLQHMQSRH